MRTLTKVVSVMASAALVFGAAGCTDGNRTTAAERDRTARGNAAETLQQSQPAETMGYSPTREGINGWIRTWDDPNAVSYVYLQGADGQLLSYFVMKGLPVSYCASITPTYDFEKRDLGDFNGDVMTPAPGVDGVYYSGGQCNSYFGFDADTGAYIEYTVGNGQNVLLFNQPLPQTNNVQRIQPAN